MPLLMSIFSASQSLAQNPNGNPPAPVLGPLQPTQVTPPAGSVPPLATSLPAATPPAARAPIDVNVLKMPPSPPGAVVSADAIKGGNLVKYGFSLGASYMAHLPVQWTEHYATDVNASYMPYVAFYPFMWGPSSGQETRAYCSAYWNFKGRVGAQEAADQLARNHAIELEIEAETEEKNKNEPDYSKWKSLTKDKKEAIEAKINADFESGNPERIRELTGWEVGSPPYCMARLLGVYVGKPGSISPTIQRTRGDGIAVPNDPICKNEASCSLGVRSASSIISFGLIFSPNVALSALAGFSFWRFADNKTVNENNSAWTVSVGLGGNLDIFSALFK
jgi:hypothetical protein